MGGVEELVAIHDRNQVLRLAEIDDIMGMAGQHVNALDIITGYLKLNDFIRSQFAFLNQAMSGNDDEELPLGIMPMLAFGDAGFGDIDADLTTIQCMHQFRETAAVIDIHLQRECYFLFRQVAEVGRVEFLGEAVGGDLRNRQCLGLLCEPVQ